MKQKQINSKTRIKKSNQRKINQIRITRMIFLKNSRIPKQFLNYNKVIIKFNQKQKIKIKKIKLKKMICLKNLKKRI